MAVLADFNVSVTGVPEGTPMVFAHGFGCDQNMWRHVAPRFEDTYRVVTFDYVGAGGARAPYDPAKYAALDGYASDVVSICHELGLKNAVFVGHSVSAMVGVLADLQDPSLFETLVMIGPSPRYINEGPYVGGFEEADIDGLLMSLSSNYLGWSAAMAPAIMGNADRPELGAELTTSFCTVDPVIAQGFARATFLSDNRADLSKVTTRTLVLQCQDDLVAPVEVGEYVAATMADATLVVLDATGHCPHLSAPEDVVAAMKNFLAVGADHR
ncbi:MAG: alpha/beta fold hydrolase [Marmoricola sp.]